MEVGCQVFGHLIWLKTHLSRGGTILKMPSNNESKAEVMRGHLKIPSCCSSVCAEPSFSQVKLPAGFTGSPPGMCALTSSSVPSH